MKFAGPAAVRAASQSTPPRLVLLTGPDGGMLHRLGQAVSKQWIKANPDLEPRRFSEDDLRADPACVIQATGSASLFGGAALAYVKLTGEKDAASIVALLDAQEQGAPPIEGAILLDMGDVARGSKTRKRFEDAKSGWSLQLYAPTREDLAAAAQIAAKSHGASLQADALGLILDEIAQDSDSVSAEVDKLALYVGQGGVIDVSVVRALGSASREAGMDEAVEAAFSGQAALCASRLEQAFEGGGNSVAALNLIGRRVRLLMQLRAGMEAGGVPGELVKNPRLGIFWMRQNDVARQATLWPRSALDEVLASVIATDASVKRAGAPAEALLERLLTRIAKRGAAASKLR
jgi:DNA polymerase III subunit delta